MSVNNLLQVAQQARQFSSAHQTYAIAQASDHLTVSSSTDSSPQLRAQNAEVLVDATINQLKMLNLKTMTVAETEEVRTVVDFAQRLIKDISHAPQINPAVVERLKAKALSAKLGGCLSPEIFTDSRFDTFRKFIEKNSLHHQIQALRMQISRGHPFNPTIPIELRNGQSVEVSWNQLKQVQRNQDGKPVGYSFFLEDEEVFQTNLKFELSDDYTFIHTGIKHYNAILNPKLVVFDKRNPAEWGHSYVLDIVTHLVDKQGVHPKFLLGDHVFVNLKDNTGNCYSNGKFGPSMANWSLSDFLTAVAKKTGKFRSPDWYSLYPKDSRFQKTFSIELTKAQFDKVFKRYETDKAKGSPEFSLMKHNCTSYHTQVLKEELGIDINSKMRPHVFTLKANLPQSVQTALFKVWDKTLGRLPEPFQKATYFFPLVYAPVVAFGLLVKAFSLVNEKGFTGTDLSLFDLFFRPWNFYAHHAFALKESLEAISPTGRLAVQLDSHGKIRLIKA